MTRHEAARATADDRLDDLPLPAALAGLRAHGQDTRGMTEAELGRIRG